MLTDFLVLPQKHKIPNADGSISLHNNQKGNPRNDGGGGVECRSNAEAGWSAWVGNFTSGVACSSKRCPTLGGTKKTAGTAGEPRLRTNVEAVAT
jgi:hypothetical protein